MFDELPIVASVSRLPQRLSETPAAVTVIDQAMIKASGMRTVEDLLRLVPGFQVTSHNQDPAIVTYHGLNSGMSNNEYGPRIQVLIDGRSMYSPLFKSGVNWNLLPVDLRNIDRIEVTRGPNTISYGSNAFMGVVNIITLDPAVTHGWSVATNLGNNGIQDATLRWGWGNEDTNVRMTYKEFADSGFQKAAYSGIWKEAMDDRKSRALDVRIDKQIDAQDELRFDLTHVEDTSQYGRPGSPANDPLRSLKQSSSSLGLQWRRALSSDEELRLRYLFSEDWAYGPYLQQNRFDTNINTTVEFYQQFDSGGRSQTHELEFDHRLSPRQDVRMMWGGGLKNIGLTSYAQFTDYQWRYRTNSRLFSNMEYHPLEQLLFNAGASIEHDSRSGNLFDWRLGLNYRPTPAHTIRLLASRAHRTPSLYEIAGRVQKTDTLGTGFTNIEYRGVGVEPEQIDSLELGYLAELKPWAASADVRAFVERIPNRIVVVPYALPASDPDQQDKMVNRIPAGYLFGRADSALNLERVRIHGYEYQLRWRPFESTRLIFSSAFISISANLIDDTLVADDQGNRDKISAQTIESAPQHSQSAMLTQQLPFGVQTSVMYFRASAMRWRRNADPIPATERIDWRLAKAFRIGDNKAEVAFTTQMWNTSQPGRLPLREAERVYWLSLSMDFEPSGAVKNRQ